MGLKSFIRKAAPLAGLVLPGVAGTVGEALGASGATASILGSAVLTGGLKALTGAPVRDIAGGALAGGLAGAARPAVNGLTGGGNGSAGNGGGMSLNKLLVPGGLALLAASSGAGPKQPAAPPDAEMPEGWDAPLRDEPLNREATGPRSAAPYFSYGTVPFSFFRNNQFQQPPAPTPLAQGGRPDPQLGALGHIRGPGTGREDKIPAVLSDGEYVFDAETVALLGDGSNDAGARALDGMRAQVRKAKGGALSRGKFSPGARQPLDYLNMGAH